MKRRDQRVLCWCHGRCARQGDESRTITSRSRDRHIAADKDEVSRAKTLGYPPARALLLALQRNEGQIAVKAEAEQRAAEEKEDQEQEEEEEDQQQQEEEEEEEAYGQNLGPSSDDGFGNGFPLADDVDMSGSEDEGQGGEPVASDLLLFLGDSAPSDGDDDEESDGNLERYRDHSNSDSDGEEEGRARQPAAAAGGARDRYTRSTHAQDRLNELVDDYDPGPMPRRQGRGLRFQDLTPSEQETVRHLQTWVEVDGTERVYSGFAKRYNDRNPTINIHSKKRALTLVKSVTGIEQNEHDMCVNSCIAYVGPNADLDHCPHVRDGEVCGEPRFDRTGKPRRRYITLPLLPRIRAQFRSQQTSSYLFDRGLQSKNTFGTAEHVFQDWPDGEIHQHLLETGLFDDPRYDLFMLSTDGAQMLNKADSDGWIVLLIPLNTPLSSRFKRSSTFVSTIIPGPKSPGDIESFLWPIMQELARAALGYWIWDEAKQEWFLWRAWLVAGCADQPGSTKINGMTGYQGYSGCKTCLMVANYPASRQVVGYFPLRTVGKYAEASWGRTRRQRNIDRPELYDPFNLPLRTNESFAEALQELREALTDAESAEVQRRTGIVQLPLLAFSPCFIHPSFFPPDIFHLFGSNISSIIWTTLNENLPGDPFSFTVEQASLFGQLVEDAGIDLPSCFAASAPRNPFEHAANYKFHEWSSMTYYYLLPFLLSVGAPIAVVEMIGHLVQGVRLTMSNNGVSTRQLASIQEHFSGFVHAWERLFVSDDLSRIHRSSISVHQLLHVATFVYWHGSLRTSSQARCEREIGLAKRSVRSKKAPFPNIANNIVQREHMRVVSIMTESNLAPPGDEEKRMTLSVRPNDNHRPSEEVDDIVMPLLERLVRDRIITVANPFAHPRCKLTLPSGQSIRGTQMDENAKRRCSRFAASGGVYAEAYCFVVIGNEEDELPTKVISPNQAYALAREIGNIETTLGITRGSWTDQWVLVDIKDIVEPIGILELDDYVYILRKPTWYEDEDDEKEDAF